MLKLEGLKLAPEEKEAALHRKAARLLHIPEEDVLSVQVLRNQKMPPQIAPNATTAMIAMRMGKWVMGTSFLSAPLPMRHFKKPYTATIT